MTTNKYQGVRIEYHILQSFPVTCLNRDDVGAPKTARVGDSLRARVSSQCWKRPVRMALHEMGVKTGTRTKNLDTMISAACIEKGATPEQAVAIGKVIAKHLSDDTLIFVGKGELNHLTEYAQSKEFDSTKVTDKEVQKLLAKVFDPNIDGLDIALFGRMVASATSMNVEAACNFAHAISTHRVSNDLEFFTAVDDNPQDEHAGSAHMGTLEFNSATYYRYISLDLGMLEKVMDTAAMKAAIEAFTKALFIAVPAARQNTMSGLSPWDYANVLVRKGQGIQISFEEPVRSENGGFSKPSIAKLKASLNAKEKMYGSLFGKLGSYEIGDEFGGNIDDLAASLQSHVTA
ncbi:MAG: type I-E CRISPR-associated protein Cas7/Cse4/CasC [Limnobacter sp.]|uniref:type I-E CRISPR-associated protein Cas7/Cse4/CasC n=1 Tax=Limnobacter sp. TaxID=2003368 RepID=UPI002736C0F9|nr:type I-E CRISPR-associated protein Cas7/Cse4/CasC [Limnobacter sp.]MDP3187981.1 type I-E CRISPR-associated protein Cas7/Cse4/CasC [Limnobacter sp.]